MNDDSDKYIIKMDPGWDEKEDESKYYNVSEEKRAGNVIYREIRPLTPEHEKDIKKDEEMRNNYNNRGGSKVHCNNRGSNSGGGNGNDEMTKEKLINFYKGGLAIPSTSCHIAYYLYNFDFKSDKYDEVIKWLFPNEIVDGSDFDKGMKENYKKMIERGCDQISYNVNNEKACDLLFKMHESVNKIDKNLEEMLKEVDAIIGV